MDVQDETTFYISGRKKEEKVPIFCVFTQTPSGWKCRSTMLADGLNHDYTSKETLEQLRTWALIDFVQGAIMTTSHAEAMELLLQQFDATKSSDLLVVPVQYTVAEWADKVLAHLKHGW